MEYTRCWCERQIKLTLARQSIQNVPSLPFFLFQLYYCAKCFASHPTTLYASISFISQTSKKFTSELNNTGVVHSKFAGQTYDAVWAMALAFAKTEVLLNRQNESMAQYAHTRKDLAKLLLEQLKDLRFIGVSVSPYSQRINKTWKERPFITYVCLYVHETWRTSRESEQNCLTQVHTLNQNYT